MLQGRACLDRAQAMMEELKPQFQHFLKVLQKITHFIDIMFVDINAASEPMAQAVGDDH